MFTSRMRKIILLILLVILLLSAGLVLFQGFSQAESATFEPWPSFVMVYKDWDATRGPNHTPGYVVVRLTYRKARYYRSETLEDSVVPDEAGSFGEYSGDKAFGFDAHFNYSTTQQVLPNELYAPAEWLVPGRIARLKRDYAATEQPTSKPGIFELTYVEQVPCDPRVARCKASSAQVITRIQYRKDFMLPLGMTVTSDGILKHEITVSEFKLLP